MRTWPRTLSMLGLAWILVLGVTPCSLTAQQFSDILERAKLEGWIAVYKQQISENRANPETWVKLADAHYKLKQYADAAKVVQEAVRLMPENATLRTLLGDVLDENGNPDGAILQYLAAIRLQPDNAVAHRNLGVTYYRKGDRKRAEAAFREAIRLEPDYWNARRSVIDVLMDKKDTNGAIQEIREAIRLDQSGWATFSLPDLPPVERNELEKVEEEAAAHFYLGIFFARRNDTDRMLKEIQQAVRLQPDNPFLQAVLREYEQAKRGSGRR